MRENDNYKQVLLDIKTIAERLQFPILFVGAGARIFAFDNQYNIEGRTTKDLDFAVQLNNWSDYEFLSEQMTLSENPRFTKTNIQHKFIHISTRIEVDIVPFGTIAQPSNLLKWSDGNEMNLLGLDEALLTATILIIDGIEIKVVDPRALLALKLIAWADRKAMKDLQDIYFILNNFNDDNRIFEELLDELSEGIIEYEDAAAFLLGRDIRTMFSKATIKEIQKILPQLLENRDRLFPRLISNTYIAEDWDAKFDTILRRFQALEQGLKS